jgi:hypothetical protein
VANGAGAISVDSRIFRRRPQAGDVDPGSSLTPERV